MKLTTRYQHTLACVLTLAACTFVVSACSEDPVDETMNGKDDAGEAGSSGGTAGSGGKGGTSGGGGGESGGNGTAGTNGNDDDSGVSADASVDSSVAAPCDPSVKEVDVTAAITANTTWDCGTYLLKDLIYVKNGATLTIEPGVLVLGDTATSDPTTALIVTRGSKLNAVGTAAEPITFTSALPAGARAAGQWGGVVLLGEAHINLGTAITGGFENNIEGLDPLLATSKYGGTDDTSNCGHLEYVRIQFAGFMLSANNELNGLTVGGCGTGTKLSHIQVHRGSDDGMELFGGTVGMDHVVLTANSDDSLDWDLGWTGKVQFLVVHQATNDGDRGFEGDNQGGAETVTPRSSPTIYNATMIGNPAKLGMLLREGTLGTFRNLIMQDFLTGVDINSTAGMADPATEWPSMLSIESSVFFNMTDVGDPDGTDDDNGFVEDAALKDAARNNVTSVDPMLGSISITAPSYKPASTMLTGKATPPAGFDTAATYAGAVDPSGTDWTTGWTDYPEN